MARHQSAPFPRHSDMHVLRAYEATTGADHESVARKEESEDDAQKVPRRGDVGYFHGTGSWLVNGGRVWRGSP